MPGKDKLSLEPADPREAGPPPESWGRIAENLRRLPLYRRAGQVFVDPDPCLKQIRLNVLLDGKELIMPSPSLKEGFFSLRVQNIPFNQRISAVSPKGLAQYGTRLTLAACRELEISLFVTAPSAWDDWGNRLGEGRGFFDLSFAILTELEAVSGEAAVCGVVARGRRVTALPVDSWDVRLDFALCPDEIIEFPQSARNRAVIFWDSLEAKRIKKISPLYQLFREGELIDNKELSLSGN